MDNGEQLSMTLWGGNKAQVVGVREIPLSICLQVRNVGLAETARAVRLREGPEIRWAARIAGFPFFFCFFPSVSSGWWVSPPSCWSFPMLLWSP